MDYHPGHELETIAILFTCTIYAIIIWKKGKGSSDTTKKIAVFDIILAILIILIIVWQIYLIGL